MRWYFFATLSNEKRTQHAQEAAKMEKWRAWKNRYNTSRHIVLFLIDFPCFIDFCFSHVELRRIHDLSKTNFVVCSVSTSRIPPFAYSLEIISLPIWDVCITNLLAIHRLYFCEFIQIFSSHDTNAASLILVAEHTVFETQFFFASLWFGMLLKYYVEERNFGHFVISNAMCEIRSTKWF